MRVVKTTTIELTADEKQTLLNAVECLHNIANTVESERMRAIENVGWSQIDDTIDTISQLLTLNEYEEIHWQKEQNKI